MHQQLLEHVSVAGSHKLSMGKVQGHNHNAAFHPPLKPWWPQLYQTQPKKGAHPSFEQAP
eukprot:6107495-Prorocentrum_lima.AAC.1